MGELTAVLVIVGLVAGFGLLASLPVIVVNIVQNSARRRFTGEVADRFGLRAEMDSRARFRRARPYAEGPAGKQLVDVRTGISRSTFYSGSGGGFHRTDLCLLTVFTGRPMQPFLLRSSLRPFRKTDDFDSAFTMEAVAGTPELDHELRLKLLGIRRDHFRSLEIAVREDGRIESTTAPLLSRRTARGVMELLEAMLHMGSAL